MKKYLCIGGPLDGQIVQRYTTGLTEYTEYNCANGGDSSIKEIIRAYNKGYRLAPTMVWIHKSILRKAFNDILIKIDPSLVS